LYPLKQVFKKISYYLNNRIPNFWRKK